MGKCDKCPNQAEHYFALLRLRMCGRCLKINAKLITRYFDSVVAFETYNLDTELELLFAATSI